MGNDNNQSFLGRVFETVLFGWIAGLLANQTATLLATITPFAGTVVVVAAAVWSRIPLGAGLPILLAAGWSMTLFVTALWYYNHRARRIELTSNLTSMMIEADYVSYRTIARKYQQGILTRNELKGRVKVMLEQLVETLEFRIPLNEKAAAFLTLDGEGDAARFQLFAQANYGRHEMQLMNDVAQLTRDNSLAGQALNLNGVISVEDCTKIGPDDEIVWKVVRTPLDYRSRTVVPVQLLKDERTINIGVICFDIKRARLMSHEDEEIALAMADKIAFLWMLGPEGMRLVD
jgi:hypothetical protein